MVWGSSRSAENLGHAHPGHTGEISQIAVGEVDVLQGKTGALAADRLGHLVVQASGQFVLRRADFLDTDPIQTDHLHPASRSGP
jgi:hypothetical protein